MFSQVRSLLVLLPGGVLNVVCFLVEMNPSHGQWAERMNSSVQVPTALRTSEVSVSLLFPPCVDESSIRLEVFLISHKHVCALMRKHLWTLPIIILHVLHARPCLQI